MENAMRLKELSEELHTNINELLSGNMSPAQTQHLVELCSELYEKLIVLRFKAFSETITPAEKMQAVLETSEPIKIDTTPVLATPELANQVNLIDAIEEVLQDSSKDANALQDAMQDSSKDANALQDAMQDSSKDANALQDAMQDSSKDANAQQDVTQDSSKDVAQDASQDEDNDDEDIVFQLIPNDEPAIEAPKGEVKPMVSLNDTFKENASQQASIAKKLEGSAISDLKKNISLNQRFQFCKDLFKGNNQEYELILEKLNNTNRDEAMRILQTLRDKYSWNPESMAAKDFTDLVNRRYMA
jgi:vacuolar-type H+-ATPase catalytic subunit A/Vma1